MWFAVVAAALLATQTPAPERASLDAAVENIQATFDADAIAVKVVTFGPGDDLTEWFGHTAIVVEQGRWSRLYNYGEFQFDATTLPRYALGHLTFHVGERPVQATLERYAQHDRFVRVATLALSREQKVRIKKLLRENALPENRDYLYDHYVDNCTTRVRDLIDVVTDGQLRAQARPGTGTFRTLTAQKTARSPVVAFVLDFLLNKTTDVPLSTWEEAFLPDEFERQLLAATVVDAAGARVPLVQHSEVFWQGTRPPPTDAPAPLWAFALVGVVVAVVVVALGGAGRVAGVVGVGVVVGGLGAALFFMAFFTDHAVAHGNLNLLLAHPLWLAVSVLALVGRRGPRPLRGVVVVGAVNAALAGVAVAVAVVGAVVGGGQDTRAALLLLVPVALSVPVAGWRYARRGQIFRGAQDRA